MNPSCKYNTLSLGDLILCTFKICQNQHLEVVAGDGFAQRGSSDDVLALLWCTDSVEEFQAVCKCVRVAHGNVYFVLVMLQRKLKTERIQSRWLLLLILISFSSIGYKFLLSCLITEYFAVGLIVLVVCNIVTCSIPTFIAF